MSANLTHGLRNTDTRWSGTANIAPVARRSGRRHGRIPPRPPPALLHLSTAAQKHPFTPNAALRPAALRPALLSDEQVQQ